MNQKDAAKAFAIFVGAIMVFSAFAGFILRSGNPEAEETDNQDTLSANLADFGVSGRLLDSEFADLSSVVDMCPQSTTAVYWLDMPSSPNITSAALEVLPTFFDPSVGLRNTKGLYSNPVTRTAMVVFNKSWVEFHWVNPFRVGYKGLVIPYDDYMMIPSTEGSALVVGRPILFGPQPSVEKVLDVITGSLPSDRITLPYEVSGDDLQIAGVGGSQGVKAAPLGGGYEEYYLGLRQDKTGKIFVTAKYVGATGSTRGRIDGLARTFGLASTTGADGVLTLQGAVATSVTPEVIRAFLST